MFLYFVYFFKVRYVHIIIFFFFLKTLRILLPSFIFLQFIIYMYGTIYTHNIVRPAVTMIYATGVVAERASGLRNFIFFFKLNSKTDNCYTE